ncbi:MAG: response regulator, partial [Clostridia bacterium]|nr:response regulator [Clostridia bacterium]
MRKSKVKAPSQISILTVDDDPIITSTIKDYFERSGYDVDIENNPVNAIEKVRNGKYDIMLLDFLMTPI